MALDTPLLNGLRQRSDYSVAPLTQNEFQRGITRGGLGIRAGVKSLGADLAESLDAQAAEESLRLQAQQDLEEAAKYQARVATWRDAAERGQWGNYIQGLAGAAVPSLGVSLTAGAATKLGIPKSKIAPYVAPMVTGLPMNAGEVSLTQQQDEAVRDLPIGQRLATSLGAGVGMAALDAIPVGRAINDVAGVATKAIPKRGAVSTAAGDILSEGVTEAAQAKVGHMAHGLLNPDRDTTNDQTDLEESFLGGVAGGTMMAAPHVVANKVLGGEPSQKDETGYSREDSLKELGKKQRVPKDIASDPTKVEEFLNQDDEARAQHAVNVADDLLNDEAVAPRIKEHAAALADDPYNPELQQRLASGIKWHKTGVKIRETAIKLVSTLKKEKHTNGRANRAGLVGQENTLSEDDTIMFNEVMPTAWRRNEDLFGNTEAMLTAFQSLKATVNGVAKNDESSIPNSKKFAMLADMFGEELPGTMGRAYKMMVRAGELDPNPQLENALNQLAAKAVGAKKSIYSIVKENLAIEHGNPSRSELKELADAIHHAVTTDMPKGRFDALMNTAFGPNRARALEAIGSKLNARESEFGATADVEETVDGVELDDDNEAVDVADLAGTKQVAEEVDVATTFHGSNERSAGRTKDKKDVLPTPWLLDHEDPETLRGINSRYEARKAELERKGRRVRELNPFEYAVNAQLPLAEVAKMVNVPLEVEGDVAGETRQLTKAELAEQLKQSRKRFLMSENLGDGSADALDITESDLDALVASSKSHLSKNRALTQAEYNELKTIVGNESLSQFEQSKRIQELGIDGRITSLGIGPKGPYAKIATDSADDGVIYVRRAKREVAENEDAIDKETGEWKTDESGSPVPRWINKTAEGESVPISVQELIKMMRKRKDQGAFEGGEELSGTQNLRAMLMSGLGSLMLSDATYGGKDGEVPSFYMVDRYGKEFTGDIKPSKAKSAENPKGAAQRAEAMKDVYARTDAQEDAATKLSPFLAMMKTAGGKSTKLLNAQTQGTKEHARDSERYGRADYELLNDTEIGEEIDRWVAVSDVARKSGNKFMAEVAQDHLDALNEEIAARGSQIEDLGATGKATKKAAKKSTAAADEEFAALNAELDALNIQRAQAREAKDSKTVAKLAARRTEIVDRLAALVAAKRGEETRSTRKDPKKDYGEGAQAKAIATETESKISGKNVEFDDTVYESREAAEADAMPGDSVVKKGNTWRIQRERGFTTSESTKHLGEMEEIESGANARAKDDPRVFDEWGNPIHARANMSYAQRLRALKEFLKSSQTVADKPVEQHSKRDTEVIEARARAEYQVAKLEADLAALKEANENAQRLPITTLPPRAARGVSATDQTLEARSREIDDRTKNKEGVAPSNLDIALMHERGMRLAQSIKRNEAKLALMKHNAKKRPWLERKGVNAFGKDRAAVREGMAQERNELRQEIAKQRAALDVLRAEYSVARKLNAEVNAKLMQGTWYVGAEKTVNAAELATYEALRTRYDEVYKHLVNTTHMFGLTGPQPAHFYRAANALDKIDAAIETGNMAMANRLLSKMEGYYKIDPKQQFSLVDVNAQRKKAPPEKIITDPQEVELVLRKNEISHLETDRIMNDGGEIHTPDGVVFAQYRGDHHVLALREKTPVRDPEAENLDAVKRTAPKPPDFAKVKEATKLKMADAILAPAGGYEGYAAELGAWAKKNGLLVNAAKAYAQMVYVSVPGKGRGFPAAELTKLIEQAKAVLASGGALVTDNEYHATRSHNAVGEAVLRTALLDAGYTPTEVDGVAVWQDPNNDVDANGYYDYDTSNPYYEQMMDYEADIAEQIRDEQRRDEEAGRANRQADRQRPDISKREEPFNAEARAELLDRIITMIGKQVDVIFKQTLTDPQGNPVSGWFDVEGTKEIIRLSLAAADPTSVGMHEAMHVLFKRLKDAGNDKILKILTDAANSPSVRDQLERLLRNEPEALQDMRDSEEERLAYMFQFWTTGQLTIGPTTKTLFQKITDFLRKVVGLLSNDQYAEVLFTEFYNGNMSTPAKAAKAYELAKVREQQLEILRDWMQPAVDGFSKLVFTAESRLMDSENPFLQKIARYYNNAVGDENDNTAQGFFSAKAQMTGHFMNRLKHVMKGVDPKDMEIALEYLQTGNVNGTYKPAAVLAAKVRDLLSGNSKGMSVDGEKSLFTYLRESGVSVFDKESKTWKLIGYIKDYFPRVWNVESILENRDEFEALLMKHHSDVLTEMAKDATDRARKEDPKAEEVTAEAIARGIVQRFAMDNGIEDIKANEHNVGFSAYMQAVSSRSLNFLDMEVFHKFLEKDMVNTLTAYINQGVKRAEYTKRFGADGKGVETLLKQAYDFEFDKIAERELPGFKAERDKIKAAADKTAKEMYKRGDLRAPGAYEAFLEGELLKGLRTKYQGWDKLQSEFDKEADSVMHAARNAVMALDGSIGHDVSPELRRANMFMIAYQNLRLLPLTLFSSLIDPLGIIIRGGEMKDAYAAFKRGVNEVILGWQDKESDDAAAHLAEMIGTVDAHAFLGALGETYSSMYMYGAAKNLNDQLFKWNGMEAWNRAMRISATDAAISFIKRHVLNPNEHSERFLKELHLTKDDVVFGPDGGLDMKNPKIREAIMTWVDGAILRPNAAMRPVWGSDPTFAIFMHLKQFTYTFHKVILGRVANEYKHGNTDPLLMLVALYVPGMMAAEVSKDLLKRVLGYDNVRQDWGLGEYAAHAVQRAGLFGIPGLGVEAGKSGVNADGFVAGVFEGASELGGPVTSQAADVFTQDAGETAGEALPLNPLYRGIWA